MPPFTRNRYTLCESAYTIALFFDIVKATTMIKLLIKIAGNSVALYVTALYVDGIVFQGSLAMLLWAGFLLTLSSSLKSIFKFVTLPLVFLSFGILGFVLDFIASATILWGIDLALDPLVIDGFIPFISGAIILTIASNIIMFALRIVTWKP